jgi:hypothetical protein
MLDEREPAEPELTPDLEAIERQLARLAPVPLSIDRDRLMFEAGRASVAQPRRLGYIAVPSRVGARFWPIATATMTAASVLLATMLVWQRQSAMVVDQPISSDVVVRAPKKAKSTAPNSVRPEVTNAFVSGLPRSTTGYLGVRNIALAQGIGALQPTMTANVEPRSRNLDAPPAKQPTSRELMDQLLPGYDHNAHPPS